MKEIKFEELPEAAKNGISDDQQSYADEFIFVLHEKTGMIEAYYAEELLAVFDGKVWVS